MNISSSVGSFTSKRLIRVPRSMAWASSGWASGAMPSPERSFDGGMLKETGISFKEHLDPVARVMRFDIAHGAGEDEVSIVDERDGVAELFDLVHAMGREKDGAALAAEVDEGVLQNDGVDGIESAEGLVHDDEFGLMQQGRDELDLLLHSLGELFSLFADGVGDPEALAPVVGALAGGGRAETVELPQEDELVHHLHLLIETALLGQVADAMEVLAGEGLAEETDGAGIGHRNADHHTDGGGFAGAIGAEETEHGAGFDVEADVVDGDFCVVDLTDFLELDDGHGFS
jgi:hypothetical protein